MNKSSSANAGPIPGNTQIDRMIMAAPLPNYQTFPPSNGTEKSENEPVAWLYHGGENKFPIPKNSMLVTVFVSFDRRSEYRNEIPLYAVTPQIEKLQSENAKLRAELAKFDQGNLLLQENGYPHLQVKE